MAKALARAHYWYEQLTNGEVSTMEEIASRAGCCSTYVKRILQCAMLSPNITEELLSRERNRRFNLGNLRATVPLDWREQEQKYLDLRLTANRSTER